MWERMPFGKYRGMYLSDVPDDYLEWLHDLPDLRYPLREAVEEEWRRRFDPDWRKKKSAKFQSSSVAIPVHLQLLAAEIVELGYRVAAKRYHPDTGGSHEDMLKLNDAIDILRKIVS